MLSKCGICKADVVQIENRQGAKVLLDPSVSVYKVRIVEKTGRLDGHETGERLPAHQMIFSEHRCGREGNQNADQG